MSQQNFDETVAEIAGRLLCGIHPLPNTRAGVVRDALAIVRCLERAALAEANAIAGGYVARVSRVGGVVRFHAPCARAYDTLEITL